MLLIFTPNYGQDVRNLAQRAIDKSHQLKIQQSQISKAKIDKAKAYEAYLPKITAEASYTHMNDDIRFSEDFENLLNGTQRLLIKEQVAMTMAPLAVPDAYKVNFGTSYTANAANPQAPNSVLAAAVQQNAQPIPAIQEQNFAKASINAQMLLFSGLKVPYSIKAASHQEQALVLMSENEKMNIIQQVISVYDNLAILYQSKEVLEQSTKLLNEQKRFVEKAYASGLAIDLNRKKIELAQNQLDVKKIEIESKLKLVYYRIEELTGLPYDSAAMLKPEVKPWELLQFNGDATNRKDIQAIDEAIIATNFKRKAEWTEYMPKIVAVGKKELYTADLTMLEPEWYVGIGLKWTIFDGLTAKNNAQQVKLDRIILEEKKLEATELAGLNLNRLKFEIEKEMKIIEASKLQVNIATEMQNLSQKQFEQGLISFNDNLSAVNDYEKAQLDFLMSVARERALAAEYLSASGQLQLDNIQ